MFYGLDPSYQQTSQAKRLDEPALYRVQYFYICDILARTFAVHIHAEHAGSPVAQWLSA